MPPPKKFKSDHTGEICEASGQLDPPALVLAAGPMLWGMPAEMLRLIALEMSLEDLYHLAQTCKDMRARLWCKSATSIWADVIKARTRGSRHTQQPPYLKVPEFVHILVSSHCYKCGASGAGIFDPYMARVCSTCLRNDSDTTVWYGDAAKQIQSLDCDLSNAILSHAVLSNYFIILDASDDNTDFGKNRLLQHDVDRVVERYKEVGAFEDKDSMKRFIALLKDVCENQRLWSQQYHYAMRARRKATVRKERNQRFDECDTRASAPERLGEELDYLDASGKRAIFKLPYVRHGTERSGECPVEDVLLPQTRAKLRYEEYRAVLRPRMDALEAAIVAHCVQLPRTSKMDIRPKPIDFVFAPECRAVLDLPRSAVVTPNLFAPFIPRLVQTWRMAVREQLTGYVRRHIGPIPDDVDPLQLAVTVFACPSHTRTHKDPRKNTRRVSPIHYPSVFGHACFRFERTALPGAEEDGYSYSITRIDFSYNELAELEKKWKETQRTVPFDASTLQDGPAVGMAMQRMRGIVSALGLDPARATVDDLEACGGWLRCVQCRHSRNRMRYVYDWVAAFEHEYGHTDIDAEVGALWQRVDQADVLVAIEEFEAQRDRVCDPGAYWACSLCPTFDAFGKGMKQHLVTQHGLTDSNQAIRNGTIYAHPLKTHRRRGRCIKSPLCDEGERHYSALQNCFQKWPSGTF